MAWQLKTQSALPEGPGFNFQHLHNGSQILLTLVPEDLMPSSDLRRHLAYMWHILDTHIWHTYIHDRQTLIKVL